jgi:predicted MPP superfamily phosphohydrolase
MKKKYNSISSLILFISLLFSFSVNAQNQKFSLHSPEGINGYNFIIANDLGRNGYYDQKPIAETMGEWADKADIHFVAAAGDIHHFNGVASISDPLWMTNYELIYSHPELMLDWYPVLGNHEYHGNTKAVLDYSKVSRRWVMPARYYTMVKQVDEKTAVRLIFIDTAPLITKYRTEKSEYPDACKQNDKAQLRFIDSVLSVSKEKWKIVIGHHPVFAQTSKDDSERLDMQARLDPLLKKYKVDYYVCGHIHNFQHIQKPDSPVNYIVNSSASSSRKVQAIDGTVFCSDKTGFSICSVTDHKFTIYFIDKDGNEVYSYAIEK